MILEGGPVEFNLVNSVHLQHLLVLFVNQLCIKLVVVTREEGSFRLKLMLFTFLFGLDVAGFSLDDPADGQKLLEVLQRDGRLPPEGIDETEYLAKDLLGVVVMNCEDRVNVALLVYLTLPDEHAQFLRVFSIQLIEF